MWELISRTIMCSHLPIAHLSPQDVGACDATVKGQVRSGRHGCRLGSKVFLNVSQGGQNSCTQIQIKYFPENPRKEKVWSMQLGGGGSVEGASCSGSPGTPTAQVHSCEAGHRSPLRVSVCKQRLGQVTPSSTAPLGANTALPSE